MSLKRLNLDNMVHTLHIVTVHANDTHQAEQRFDAAQSKFSEVVDCCGEGLASIEQILQGTTTIIHRDGEEGNAFYLGVRNTARGGKTPQKLLHDIGTRDR